MSNLFNLKKYFLKILNSHSNYHTVKVRYRYPTIVPLPGIYHYFQSIIGQFFFNSLICTYVHYVCTVLQCICLRSSFFLVGYLCLYVWWLRVYVHIKFFDLFSKLLRTYSTVSDDDESATGNNENIEIVNEGGKNNELVMHIANV